MWITDHSTPKVNLAGHKFSSFPQGHISVILERLILKPSIIWFQQYFCNMYFIILTFTQDGEI